MWGEQICGSGPPDLDGDVGGCGDKGLVVLSKDDIVDPMRVCLGLLAELGRGRFRVEGVGIGERVLFVLVVGGEVEVEIPGAYDAVSTAGVAVPSGVSSRWQARVEKGASSEPLPWVRGLTEWNWLGRQLSH